MIRQVESRHESFPAAHDHHHQQIGNHHHVNQPEYHQHDLRLGEIIGSHLTHQMNQLAPELPHVQRLRHDQADIKRRLQPAAHEYPARQRSQHVAFSASFRSLLYAYFPFTHYSDSWLLAHRPYVHTKVKTRYIA